MSFKTAMIGGIGGAIVGFFTGGATGALQGLQVGTFIGGLIDQPKSPSIVGPRLSDLTVQTSTYGAVMPRVYGTIAICGNVFWLENNRLKEVATKKKSGGKGSGGGSEYKTYAYYATFALGLCKCPSGPIIGVKRIWIKGILWYDAGSSDYGAIRASNAASALFTVHTGSDTQLPDARMQATLGAANTPAYRGLAYIVFKDFPLKDYGNSLMGAQIKVEIVSNGSIAEYTIQTVTHSLPLSVDVIWDGTQFLAVNQGNNTSLYSTSPDGVTWTVRSCPGAEGANGLGSIGSNGRGLILASWAYQTGVWKSTNGRTWKQVSTSANSWNFVKVGSKMMMFPREYHGSPSISEDGENWSPAGSFTPYGSFPVDMPVSNDKIAVAVVQERQMIYVYDISGNYWTIYATPYTMGFSSVAWMPNIGKWFFITQDNRTGLTSDFVHWQLGTGPAGGWGEARFAGDRLFLSTDASTFYWTKDGVTWSSWTIPAIIMYGICYNEGIMLVNNTGNTALRIRQNVLSTTTPTLASIISSECSLSNILKPTDIDVTAMTQSVKGFAVSSVAAIRSGLSPLQGNYQFDIIQSGYKLKFKLRGGSSVVTIPAKDLGAEGVK